MDSMITKNIYEWHRQWNEAGGRLGTHERFGQYVINRDARLAGRSNPDLFYNENTELAYIGLASVLEAL
jgi:hypothetical protein